MELLLLVGNQFKYNSPTTGISDWTDEITSVFIIHKLIYNKKSNKVEGYTPEINIRGKKNNHVYPLNNCILDISYEKTK